MNQRDKLRRAKMLLFQKQKDGTPVTADDLKSLELKEDPQTPPADSWPELFTSYQEFTEAEEPQPVIEQFMCTGEITVVGALPKNAKTWFMLSMVKSLLSGKPFLNYFKVPVPSKRVIYLVPEAGLAQMKRRLNLMRLMQYLNPEHEEQRLFVMPRRINMVTDLADARILKAAEGADVFLDTLVRFVEGDENNVADIKKFSNLCLNLATIARTVTIAHHSPKAFGDADTMTLENMLRGSGDLGAMLSNAFGLRQINKETNQVHIACLAARDDDKFLKDFQIEGRPHINNSGDFLMTKKPGEAGKLSDHVQKKSGRKRDPKTEAWLPQAITMDAQGIAHTQIAVELVKKGFEVSRQTVGRRIAEVRKQAGMHQGELKEQTQ